LPALALPAVTLRALAAPALLAAWLAVPGEARAAVCALPDVVPTAWLNEKRGEIRFSNGYSGRQLEDKRRKGGGAAAPGPDWHPVGLMGRDLKWELKVEVTGERRGGRYCVGLKSAEMTIGYDRIDVYVDRRYRPGTCQYDVILDHENQHVRNFQSTLAGYIPTLRQRLEVEAAEAQAVVAGSMNSGAKHFVRHLTRRLTPVIERMQRDMADADRRLDTPESYRATQARCDGW
jgi:hypothetical protein